jgi:hypothetical protein
MELLDVKNYIFEGEKRTYYDVSYKGKQYRRYKFYWSAIFEDGAAGVGSVDNDYQRHLEKVWEKTYGNKKISKTIQLVVEDIF